MSGCCRLCAIERYIDDVFTALELAEDEVHRMKCPDLKVRRYALLHRRVLVGEWLCEEDERLCEQLLWLTNEYLERVGFTAVYIVYPGYKHVIFRAYRGQRELLNTLLTGQAEPEDELEGGFLAEYHREPRR